MGQEEMCYDEAVVYLENKPFSSFDKHSIPEGIIIYQNERKVEINGG